MKIYLKMGCTNKVVEFSNKNNYNNKHDQDDIQEIADNNIDNQFELDNNSQDNMYKNWSKEELNNKIILENNETMYDAIYSCE